MTARVSCTIKDVYLCICVHLVRWCIRDTQKHCPRGVCFNVLTKLHYSAWDVFHAFENLNLNVAREYVKF